MKCNDDSCDQSHCSRCGCHMMGVYLEPGVICDSCRLLEEYLGPRTPEQYKNLFCKLVPDQTKLEIYKGNDFLGFVDAQERKPTITWFIAEGQYQFVEITFEDVSTIIDSWKKMLKLQHDTKTFPCPHCGFVRRNGVEHEFNPDNRSATCGSCGNIFNIPCSGCGCEDHNHKIDCPNLQTN